MTWWKQTRSLMALVLASLLFATPMSVADATTSNFTVNGNTALATFEATDPFDSCIVFEVMIVASDSMQKVSPGGGKSATVGTVLLVTETDVCAGMVLFNGEGETAQQTLRFKNVTSATLATTMQVTEITTGQVESFTVNLTWNAAGPAVTETLNEKFRDRDLGIMVHIKVRGSHAPAVATGTVVGLGANFTPDLSDSAELESQNDGTLTVQMTR
jgi:hypothetical protein